MQTSVVIKCDSTHLKALAMLGTQKILALLITTPFIQQKTKTTNQTNKELEGRKGGFGIPI